MPRRVIPRSPMPDDYSAPLGRRTAGGGHSLSAVLPAAGAALLACGLVVFAGWVMLVDDPLGGEPFAVAPTRPAVVAAARVLRDQPPPAMPAAASPAPAEPVPASPAPAGQTITIIDGTSGARQTVTVAAPAQRAEAPVFDERLVETSRHGLLPKMAADGTRPSVAYASPKARAAAEGPRIALVVGRLGISETFTTDAFAKLPDTVTFAFLPYGSELARWVARARREGREVLMQVPMEPFDYPDNDPGPHTLVSTLTPAQNLDRLHAVMGAAQGYVGLGNYMGARLSAHEPSMAALLREAAGRGLIYFEQGTARSLAASMAGPAGVAFARADLVVDATANAIDIDAALARLETIARERGSAIGAATALPVTVDRLARWTQALAARGITLVPISALATRPSSS